jgi:uncharacterized protein YndB with AHSA1/START domain
MVKKLFLALVLVLAALLIYAATLPGSFRVARSADIAAPPAKLHALISDLRQFNVWNPFLRQDPKAQLTYEGAASGVGSAYRWQGEKSGAGRMEVIESAAPKSVAMKLDFSKPFEAQNRVDFTIEPQGTGSRVTWAMSGPSPFISKLMSVFFSMDKMVGGEFDNGLANLKALAEKP